MFLEFPYYHDLVQSCQGFAEDLDELVYGSEKDSQQLKMAADRLLCVTALLRNFSFVEFNHQSMASEDVIRFVSRLLHGLEASKARPFMVSNRNNLELVRDLVTILSNVAHCIRLPDLDCAQSIFSFILSFSSESHRTLDPENLIFSAFKLGRDTYLPPALDALAKLLVVDHPNKEYFTNLLRASTDKPTDSKFTRADIFLTRAFGMAVSVLPTNEAAQVFFTKEERMALAEQGMLAASALVDMLPLDGDLARYWLSAKDNFGARLVRTVFHLAAIPDQRLPVGVPSGGGMYSHITRRGMRIVEVMSSRATKGLKDGDIVAVACSKKEQLLGAMLTTSMDGAIVESLWKLHDIEDTAAGASPPRSSESPKRAR
jgi:SWI/SNF chromatin-remodeling complex subunit SWI1